MGVPGDLEVALNEATVVGLRAEPGRAVSLLLHVLALPEEGPPDPDTRRALVLSGVSRVRVLLRRDIPGEVDYGPAVPLADLAAVEEFFASLTHTGDLYGWEFLDAPDLVADWPAEVSLELMLADAVVGTHSLYWFNECGTPDGSFCIEGLVEFTDVTARHADGTPVPIEEFVADGRRWWQAFRTGDPRVVPAAQR
ncbi:hypothetical protein, partial [Actinophytocola sp.]|uniref:hypothetical protein n=1 Tax=Actinophytocola sp. TaxID=1872138 RepID=UPI003D6BE30A